MKKYILIVLCALLGLMMLNSGFNKFFHYMEMPEMGAEAGALLGAFMASKWLFPLVAIAEIVGGAAIAIPRTRALGAVILFPIVLGIMLFHAVQDTGNIIVSIIMLAIVLFVIVDNREKYMPMIKG